MAVSIINHPNTLIDYITDNSFNEIPNIITNNITAYRDLNGTALPLILGASGNMEIETLQDANIYIGTNNAYTVYTASYDSNTDLRTNVEILRIDNTLSTTMITSAGNITLASDNPSNTVTIGSLELSQIGGEQMIGTSLSNVIFSTNVVTQGDLTVGANLFTTGNIFGKNLNVWSDKTDSNIAYDRVGFGLRVNSNDQLEIIKYARFENASVTKRIAVFGANKFTSNDVTDDATSSYLAFNALGSISVIGSNGSLSAIGSSTATSGTDMTLYGTTGLAGNIIPSISTTTIGSSSSNINTIFTSNVQAYTYKLADGSALVLDSYTSTSTSNVPTSAALNTVYTNMFPKTGGILTGDLTISGNFTVSGTTTTVNTESLLITDNIIMLNSSLSNSAPPSNLVGGIEVERGTLSNYFFVFDESSQYFKVGMSNQLQVVCTREETMDSGYAYYNSSLKQLVNRNPQYSDLSGAPWQYVSYSNNSSNIVFTTDSNVPNVGIGTSNPDYKLTVNGQIYASDDITAFSDSRMKENLVKIPDALSKIKQISGYTFTRKDMDNSKHYAGVLAQELQAVLPEVVYENSQGMLSVAYGNITALLIEAVKDLNEKCELLRNPAT
jgi:hypothetical protein